MLFVCFTRTDHPSWYHRTIMVYEFAPPICCPLFAHINFRELAAAAAHLLPFGPRGGGLICWAEVWWLVARLYVIRSSCAVAAHIDSHAASEKTFGWIFQVGRVRMYGRNCGVVRIFGDKNTVCVGKKV